MRLQARLRRFSAFYLRKLRDDLRGRANWKFTQWCGSNAEQNTWEGYAVGKDSRCKPTDGPPNCRPADPWEMDNFMPLPASEAKLFHGTQYFTNFLGTCKGASCNKVIDEAPAGWSPDDAILQCHNPGPKSQVVETFLDPDFDGQHEGLHRLDAVLGMQR